SFIRFLKIKESKLTSCNKNNKYAWKLFKAFKVVNLKSVAYSFLFSKIMKKLILNSFERLENG
ncbi:MAG: hypothetical protein L0L86_04640, partial [Lactococcus lactis]|nr:hypothetical protein [Lactococcus lactis]